jgi:SAM-dependent methyltransferase
LPESVREQTQCRVCNSERLETYLDLGVQPLANAFRKPDDTSPEMTAPLQLARCLDCGLSQLHHVVSPEVLYRNYLYESGHSEGWKQHCAELADEIKELLSICPRNVGPLVCDIACNDGVLLRCCHEQGLYGYGVEPARNLSTGAIPVVREFWTHALAKQMVEFPGKSVIIVAQNVLGHVDDVLDFLRGIATALMPNGMAIIECPHIHPLLTAGAFDTVYHEHLSYWSLGPLMQATQRAGLRVVNVQMFPNLHGGTCRYYLRHAEGYPVADHYPPDVIPERVQQMLDWEDRTLTPGSYADFGRVVKHTLERLNWILCKEHGVTAYGASAKSTVLLNALAPAARQRVNFIFDDTPQKQGLLTPGSGIEICAPPEDFSAIDSLLITAPNWATQIKEKVEARGFTGQYILPWYGVTVEDACPVSSS